MSARDEILAHPGVLATADTKIAALLDVYRAEVLAEVDKQFAAMKLPEELKGTFNAGSYGDAWRRCRAIVQAMAEEKATAPAATATPGLTERQTRLLDAIRTHGGEWTTRRVLHLFALTDPGVVQRGTARRDLAALNRAGHLVLVDDPDKRHYALNTRKGGA